MAIPAWDWRKLAAGLALLVVGIAVGMAIHAGLQAVPDKTKPVASALPAKPDATPSVSPPAAAPTPASVVAPAPVVVDVIEQRLAATQKWLDAEPPDTSSMQLMVAHDMQNLRQRLEKIGRQVEIDKIYVYRTQAGGRAAWAVLYGSYPSRKELYIAMQQLPPSLKSYSPYLRTVQGIRAEIGKFHDEAINDAK